MDPRSGKHRRNSVKRRQAGPLSKRSHVHSKSRRSPPPTNSFASAPIGSNGLIQLPKIKRESPVFKAFLVGFCGVFLLIIFGGSQHVAALGFALILSGTALLIHPPIAPESRSNSTNASNTPRVNYQRYSMHTPSPYIRARAVNTQSPSSRSSSNTSCYSSVTSSIPASPAHGVKFTSLVHSTPTRWRLKTTNSKSAAPTYKPAYAGPVSVKTLRPKPESDEDQVYPLPASE